MKVLNIKENEDGSANVELDIDDTELNILVEYAIVTLLKEYIKSERDINE